MNFDIISKNKKDTRVQSAISAAAELYLKHGIDAVKMTDIADASQIGVASLYRYFGTKQQITVKAAAYIWNQILHELDYIYATDAYQSKSGIDQVAALLSVFPILLNEHADFVQFLGELDAFVLREQTPHQDLSEYEESVLNVFPLMKHAAAKGIADGTIRKDINVALYYFAVSHSLMSLCQKIVRGKILSTDTAELYRQELQLVIDMYISYIRA